jgi:phosphoglycolate phosphatase
MNDAPFLILFDVDGTLLRSDGCGRRAVEATLREVFGVGDEVSTIRFAGQTDWQIWLDILTPLGHTPESVARQLPVIAAVMARHLEATIHHYDVRPLPGALELVRDLQSDSRVRLGLVTGNLSQTTPIKLRAAGFDPASFPVGAFGDEAISRSALPPLALRRAGAYWHTAFAPERIVVVGDTPNDIICARSVRARAVAVLTGPSSGRAVLEAEVPYAVLENLTDRAQVYAALFGEAQNG